MRRAFLCFVHLLAGLSRWIHFQGVYSLGRILLRRDLWILVHPTAARRVERLAGLLEMAHLLLWVLEIVHTHIHWLLV